VDYSPKIAKIGIFWYKFAQKGITLSAIFTKFGLVEGVPGPHPHTKFHHSGFTNVGLQSQKNRYFWYGKILGIH